MSLLTELINFFWGKAINLSSLTGLKGQYEISLIWQLRSSGMFMDCPYKERISPNPKGIPARLRPPGLAVRTGRSGGPYSGTGRYVIPSRNLNRLDEMQKTSAITTRTCQQPRPLPLYGIPYSGTGRGNLKMHEILERASAPFSLGGQLE